MSNLKIFRYAPGITGNLHIGNFKVLLFNVLMHEQDPNSKLVLRYDDTDLNRNKFESIANIATIINLFKICFSKIVFQSEHIAQVADYIQRLANNNAVYYCQCPETQDKSACICKLEQYNDGVLMLEIDKVLKDSKLIIEDTLNGEIVFRRSDMYDLALTRSNGSPLYNFVTVVSDIADGITHIIRGNDHIINTWKQVMIYKALNIPVPTYTHISMILTEDKAKISKSKNNSISIIDMIKMGYTTTAIKQYMKMIIAGASTLEELEARKDNLINKKSNVNTCFNIKKLQSINKAYMQSQNFLIHELQIYCIINKLEFPNHQKIQDIITTIKHRHNNLDNLYQELIKFNENFTVKYIDCELSDEEMKQIQQCLAQSNTAELFKLSDKLIRFVLLGQTTGINTAILQKFLSEKECIKRMDQYLRQKD